MWTDSVVFRDDRGHRSIIWYTKCGRERESARARKSARERDPEREREASLQRRPERGRDLAVDARGVDRLRLREEQDAPRLVSRLRFAVCGVGCGV